MSNLSVGSMSDVPANDPPTRFDPSKRLAAAAQRFLKESDADGDGMLSSKEVPGLSADAFKALDTNGDGKLSQDELTTGMKTAMEAMKQARSSADPKQAMSALRNTPEGQLTQLVHGHRHHHQRGGSAQQAQTQQPSIQITITQVVVNVSSSAVQETAATSGLDVQA